MMDHPFKPGVKVAVPVPGNRFTPTSYREGEVAKVYANGRFVLVGDESRQQWRAFVFDFKAIAARLRGRPVETSPEPVCEACEGGGWESYGLGFNDPHFRVCDACGNPEGHPCP